MPTKPLPGQAEKSVFILEQVKALASAIRSEVFWSFNSSEPHSAAEVAAALGKSAQTIHYHVNELARVGLLLAVETRKRRSRTESLYVHAARDFVGQGPTAPAEYREHIQKGFAAIARAMVREEQAIQRVFDEKDLSVAAFNAYNRVSLRLSPERAIELRRRLYEVLEEASREDPDPNGVRVHLAVYMKPTQAESRQWLRNLKASKKKRAPKP